MGRHPLCRNPSVDNSFVSDHQLIVGGLPINKKGAIEIQFLDLGGPDAIGLFAHDKEQPEVGEILPE